MTINLDISPFENNPKICVYQKCLLPARTLPNSIRCGTWVKCALQYQAKDQQSCECDVVCQLYEQTSMERASNCAFMDATVTTVAERFDLRSATLTAIKPLVETNVKDVELIVFIEADFLQSSIRAQNLQTLRERCHILLQAYCLTANCWVSSKDLQRLGLKAINIRALDCDENVYYRITEDTLVNIADVRISMKEFSNTHSTFYDIGFETALAELKKLKERSRNTALRGCLNALLTGPTGCGKSALMSHFAKQEKCNYFSVSTKDVLGQYPGETESKLRKIFDGAQKFVKHFKPNAPTLIHIEDVQLLCPAVKAGSKDASTTLRLCAQLCTLLDKLNDLNAGIICIATTTESKSLHKSLHTPGRFQYEIEMEALNEATRKSLFLLMLQERFPLHSLDQKTIDLVVGCTAGYVAADLALLVRTMEQSKLHGSPLGMPQLVTEVLKKSKPTSLRGTDVTVIKSEHGFEIIGGMEILKKKLQTNILTGLQRAECYKRFGLSLPKGILLYGPPGCAKTTIAKCLAAEAKMTFISTSSAEVYSPYVGCAEKFISKLFDTARKHAPCLIFLDEIDTLVGNRALGNAHSSNDVQTRILSTLLTEMDGIVQTRLPFDASILVVAATNRPNMIDDALLRPGRFDKLIHVPPPDYKSRLAILELHKQRMPFAQDCVLTDLANFTENFSGADICNLCNEAAMHAFQRDFDTEEIKLCDFQHVLKSLKPSLTQRQIDLYLNFKKTNFS